MPVIFFISGISVLGIGAAVLYHNPRTLVNWLFFIITGGFAVWSIGFILLYIFQSFFFSQLVLFTAPPVFGSLYLFAFAYPSRGRLSISVWIGTLPIIVLAFLIPSRLFIADVTVGLNGKVYPVNGPAMWLFALVLCAYAFSSLVILTARFKTARGEDRVRLGYLLLAIGLCFSIVALCDLLLPALHFFELVGGGPLSLILFSGLLAYAIIRHQLLDIRLVIQRGLIYSLVLASLVATYFGLLLGIAEVARLRTLIDAPIAGLIVVLFGVATVPTLEAYVRKKTDPWFFKDRYDYSEALKELTDILNTNNLPKPIVEKTEQAMGRILRAQFVRFVPLGGLLDADAVLHISISARRQMFGTLLVGPKRSGDPYLPQDERLLATFAAAFAIALQKAQLLAQVRRHSRELEKKVAERTRHLQELQDYQRRMTSDISHALQTPLTVLSGTVERLLKTKTVPQKAAGIAQESIEKLSQSLYDLLRLSKLEALPPEQHEVLNLSQLISEIVEYVRTICAERGIVLETAIDPGIVLQGDRQQIEELLNNLLSNAIKYMGAGSKKQIMVSLESAPHAVTLTVADSGMGIPAEILPHIFERFYRAPGNVTGGSGLGLAICKRIAELHGGTIVATSKKGSGSLFTLRLPVKQM